MRFIYIVILILRRLNAHLSSIVSSKPFQMPVDVVTRTTVSSGSRLSSFGFSGTIAHGAFEARKPVTSPTDAKSLYRNRRFVAPSGTTRLDWLLEAPGPQQPRLDEAVVFSGALSPSAEVLFSHHVVGGATILPGVGYVEMAFAASSCKALAAVAFLRPCVLPEPGRGVKCVLRCTRRTNGALEIASRHSLKDGSFAVHFIGSQDGTHDAVSVKSSSMLTTAKDKHDFLRAEGEFKNEADTLEYYDSVSDQKQGDPPLYEPVTSWSDEVAQTQEMESLAPQNMTANTPVKLSGTLGNEEHSQSRQSSSEIVVQLLGTSQNPDTVVIVQHEGKLTSIRCSRGGGFDGRSSTVGNLTPMGRCLPLVPTRKPKHAVESYEATNRSVVQKNTKATNKRTSAPGPAQSKKVDVSGVVQKTVEELLGTVVSNDAPLMGAGLDSLSAVDLVQTLGQRLGTELEPTALFDYPTIGSLSKYLAAQEEPEPPLVSENDGIVPVLSPTTPAEGKAAQDCFVVATAMYLPTVEGSFTNGDLEGLSYGRFETATLVPVTRWNMDAIDTRRFSADARNRVRYGSFLQSDFSMFDNTMFRISPAEARPLEPQQRMLLEVGYEALHRQGQNRSTLVDSDTGIFTGMMNMDA